MNIRVRINQQIRAPEVRVIDQEGKMAGVMTVAAALEMARTAGLDLVEVSPKVSPPVVKILNFDKYRYQLEKAEAQLRKRQKKIEVKGIRISVRIGEHDLKFKAEQADKFLSRGDKVKIELFLRGRERANLEFAFSVFKKFMESIAGPHLVEQGPKKLGNIINAVIAPKN